jgi:hypothetical protein
MVKKQQQLSEAQQAALDKAQKLTSSALEAGLFVEEKPSEYPKLVPGKGLARFAELTRQLQHSWCLMQRFSVAALLDVSGQDIFRRGTHRKAKFLFSFPGRIGLIASSANAKLGQLDGLDTPHPTLEISMPQESCVGSAVLHNLARIVWLSTRIPYVQHAVQGTFLLRGVIVQTRNKLLTLQAGARLRLH